MSALADLRGFAPNRRAAPDFAPNLERLKSTRDAAGPLGLTLVPAEARGLDALEQAFATMIGERAQALTVLSDGGAVQLSSHSGRRSDRIEPLFAAVHESAVVKVCGWRPHVGGAAHTGAGVRKPPREETAGWDTWVVRRALWGFEYRERGVRLGSSRLSKLVVGESAHD
jgi:hypothetical protein